MKNTMFSHNSLWRGMWNALNSGAVSMSEFIVICRYLLNVYISKNYYIPRVMDTDNLKTKNNKKVIIKHLIPFINTSIFENGVELTPNISRITNSIVYFNYLSRSVNDKERLIKILLTQALSIGGFEVAKNVRLDLSNNMIRFNIQDSYGSSEVVFEDVGIRVEIVNSLREIVTADFNGDIDILEIMAEEERIISAELSAKFVLGLHVVNMDGSVMSKYRTKEDVLIERFAHFVRQLDVLLPYGKYRSSINWDNFTKKDYLNIIS